MKAFIIVCFVLQIMAMVGCSDRQDCFTGDFTELFPRISPNTVTNNIPFDKLPDDAVLVAVNGYPLDKKTFDYLMLVKAKQFSNSRDSNPALDNTRLENFKKSYLRTFVNQRILIDEAKRLNVISAKDVEKKVNAIVRRRADKKKVSVKKFMKSLPLRQEYVLYDLASQVYIDQLITKFIPPKVEVNDDFIATVKADIQRQNGEAAKKNELLKAKMAQIRKDILEGRESFEKLAVPGEDQKLQDGGNTNEVVWGDFERGLVDDKRVLAVMFSTKVGEISEPVEDDDGIHLLKVYRVSPPVKNDKGRVVQDEVRRVGHIYKAKVPMLIEDTDAILGKELRIQMKTLAINEFIQNVATNGETRIEYPYGKDILK